MPEEIEKQQLVGGKPGSLMLRGGSVSTHKNTAEESRKVKVEIWPLVLVVWRAVGPQQGLFVWTGQMRVTKGSQPI